MRLWLAATLLFSTAYANGETIKPTASGFPIDLTRSVLERGKDPQRTAHFVIPSFTKANAPKMALDAGFKATFNGNLASNPLFVASTKPGKGLFIVATLNNRVYALDEKTGATRWTKDLGASAHGIIGTPIVDAAARAIYLASDDSGTPRKHLIHALALDSGNELAGWPVEASKLSQGDYHFNAQDQNQRGALSLVGHILYVPYGGYWGDGGNYRGWVVAVDTTNPANVAGWATAGQQEGIWAPGGMASDGDGVFVATGNNGAEPKEHLDSEELIRITGMAVAHHDDANLFYPSVWRSGMDHGDLDYGSCSPAVILSTGGTPAKMIVSPAKPGHLYLLDSTNLGGKDGYVRDLLIASTTAESVYTTPTVYRSPSGLRVAITTRIGALCPGGAKDSQLMGLRLDTSVKPINPVIEWCAPTNEDEEIRRRAPSSTTTDGTANPIVWFMNGAKLNGYDGENGKLLYAGGTGDDDCARVRRHTSPIAANGRIIVGGDGHLCSWSVH